MPVRVASPFDHEIWSCFYELGRSIISRTEKASPTKPTIRTSKELEGSVGRSSSPDDEAGLLPKAFPRARPHRKNVPRRASISGLLKRVQDQMI